MALLPAALVAAARSTIETSNRRAGNREAVRLLSTLTLPRAAIRLAGEPAGDHGALGYPGSALPASDVVDLPAWWASGGNATAMMDAITAHAPAGSTLISSRFVTGPGSTVSSATFSWPVVGSALGARQLTVAITTLADGETGLRADAQVAWIVPRSGRILARAAEDATVTEPMTSCDPLRFSIRGWSQTPLLRGAAFLGAVGRLLGHLLSVPAAS